MSKLKETKRNKYICRKCKHKGFKFIRGIPLMRCHFDDDRYSTGALRSQKPSEFYGREVPYNCVFKLEQDLFPANPRLHCERSLFICKQKKCFNLMTPSGGQGFEQEWTCSLCDRSKVYDTEQFNVRQCASKCRYILEHYLYYVRERQNNGASVNEQEATTSI